MALIACCDILGELIYPFHDFISLGFIFLSVHMPTRVKKKKNPTQINPSAEDLSASLKCVIVRLRNNFTLNCLEMGLRVGVRFCQQAPRELRNLLRNSMIDTPLQICHMFITQ